MDLFDYSPAPRSHVSVRLSHLESDADLVLYGPYVDEAGDRAVRARPTGSGRRPLSWTTRASGSTSLGSELPPEGSVTAGDARWHPRPLPRPELSDSTEEAAEGNEVELVKVSAYEQNTSGMPYVLRVRSNVPDAVPVCPAYSGTGGNVGTMPDLTSLPANLRTLVLTNEERLGNRFGAAAANDAMTALDDLVTAAGVNGAVLPLDGNPTVQATYAQWNSNPCHIANTNALVASVTNLIDRIRTGDAGAGIAAHPNLDTIIVAGGDDIVPMARLADTTRVGNEKTYADRFTPDTPLWAAFTTEHILSDDPYGDVDPIPVLNRRLYVPDLSVGRLVESPSDIETSVAEYLAAGGELDPSTAYQTGYDFMDDGAAVALARLTGALTSASGGTPPTTNQRIGPSWTGADVAADLTTGNPGYAGLFGHFDEVSMLSEAGHTSGSADSLDASAMAAALPVAARLVFSMGCHSGLSVADPEHPGIGPDFAQSLASRGAALVGSTGFGYGDAVTPGAGERLMALFAEGLDGRATVGEALMYAKQQYFATQGLYGPYDEKVLGETTFYGIPLYRAGGTTTNPNPDEIVTDPVPSTSLHAADVSVDPTFAPRVDTARGSYYTVERPGGGTFDPLVTANRPVQPRLDVDVTAADGANLRPAHGALVTDLSTGGQFSPFDPVFARPSVGSEADEPEVSWGDAAFPGRIAGVTSFSDPDGLPFGSGLPQRQRLVVVPGQYRGTETFTRQRLFSHVGVRVFYSSSSDYTPPDVTSATATDDGATTTFRVNAADGSGVHRVVVLWRDADTDWTSAELTDTGPGWTATIPQTVEGIEWFAQAVDEAGNVSVFSSKGRLTAAAEPPPGPVGAAPDAPTAPAARLGPSAGQSTVDWSAPADNGSPITGYRVLRGTTSGALTEIGSTSGVTTTYTDTTASAGTSEYYYAVVAQNAKGDSSPSAETSFAPVTVSISDATVLEPDVGSPAVNGRLRITLSQPAPTDTKVTYYTVDGSAAGAKTGSDYQSKGTPAKPKTKTIKAGKVSVAATVRIRSDAETETDETLTVHLDTVTLGTPVVDKGEGTLRSWTPTRSPAPIRYSSSPMPRSSRVASASRGSSSSRCSWTGRWRRTCKSDGRRSTAPRPSPTTIG